MEEPLGFVDTKFSHLVCQDYRSCQGSKHSYDQWIEVVIFGSGPVEDAQLHRSIVYQFMQNPLESYWKAVKRILRYLSGTLGYGLHLRRSENLDLVGFCDADWASNSDDRRPKSEYCVYLDSKLVACHSKNSMLFLDQVQKFS